MREIRTAALLLRAVPYGESDVITTLLTESDGKLTAIVRGGRKSSRRVGGALEPFHTIAVTLAEKNEKTEIVTMKEARLERVRSGITATLEAVDAAGRALRWLRHVCPPRIKEPAAWQTANALLDELEAARPGVDGPSAVALGAGAPSKRVDARVVLAVFALKLLADVGYGLELEQCVSCGKACPPARAADVDAFRGGVVCQDCGGGRTRLSGELRALAMEAQRGGRPALSLEQARELLTLVESAMAAHAGLDPS